MTRSGRFLPLAAFLALPLAAVVLLGGGDSREEIPLPREIHDAFLVEMKSNMANLRDLTRAIATGNYSEAARVAESPAEFGHHIWTVMEEEGLLEARLVRLGIQAEGAREQNMLGAERGTQAPFRAIPAEFRALGLDLTEAARRFTLLAQNVDSPVDPRASAALNHAYQDLVSACQACHAQYRIPREGR
jgi:predicted mannosyl-3-phosphoglycerate phosphatase (HAD superfamily)